jgi:hypothetical protein
MATKTTTIRVPVDVHAEVLSASRLLGCSPAELLERAWLAYRQAPEFTDDLDVAQQAFATGDLAAITERLRHRGEQRAQARAAAARARRPVHIIQDRPTDRPTDS